MGDCEKHIVPHVLPQFIVGLVLLFPHAILHESSITFLGFGLSTEQPAIGVILSESMRYLIMGKWWLAVFPGMMLVLTVVLFEKRRYSSSSASGSGKCAQIENSRRGCPVRDSSV